MSLIANLLTALIGIEHIGILALEMFFWDHPIGRKTFGMTPQQSADTKVLAGNQGLYNGFLAAGLLWGAASGNFQVKLFFLACVVIAGLYGGATAKRSIWFTQALPAAIALLVVVIAG